MAELRRSTEHCNYGATLPDMLRDRLVCGVVYERIQQKLLSEGEGLTLDKATNIALSMESAIAQASEIQNFQQRTDNVNKLSSNGGEKTLKPQECYRCGGNHNPESCPFKEKECFFCRNKGHTTRKCRKKARENTKQQRKIMQLKEGTDPEAVEPQQPNAEPHPFYTMYKVGLPREKPILIDIEINNNLIQMELDTGASVSVMSKNVLENHPWIKHQNYTSRRPAAHVYGRDHQTNRHSKCFSKIQPPSENPAYCNHTKRRPNPHGKELATRYHVGLEVTIQGECSLSGDRGKLRGHVVRV